MITIYGWLEIRPTFLDEDLHPEIDEERINHEVERLVSELKHTKLNIIEKNYTRFIQFGVMENHKTDRTEEIIGLFEHISRIATGSYGLLYFLDDEDKTYNDEFRVLVSKKGVTEWKKDDFFNPCSKMIEDCN